MLLFSDGVKWIARMPGSGISTFADLEAWRLLFSIPKNCAYSLCDFFSNPWNSAEKIRSEFLAILKSLWKGHRYQINGQINRGQRSYRSYPDIPRQGRKFAMGPPRLQLSEHLCKEGRRNYRPRRLKWCSHYPPRLGLHTIPPFL